MALEPITLRGSAVTLEPVSVAHVDALLAAADEDRSTFGYTVVPADVAAMHAYVEGLLDEHRRGTGLPFVQRRLSDDRPVGCTRYLNVVHRPGRDAPVEVEIGGTWLAASAQRSPINSEANLMLLTHAFEVWQVHRVAICTDARNERSRTAIERLGATFEGVLRNHRPAAGHRSEPGASRDTACYSILPDEWPPIRAHLAARIGRSGTTGASGTSGASGASDTSVESRS